jgi:uncharacterized protein
MNPVRSILVFFAGGLFGIGLAVSGMTDPGRVIGFLNVFGKWDPALVFVMVGAASTYGIGMFILRNIRHENVTACPNDNRIDRRLVVGAAIFGIGWGLGGFCPGPALCNLGALRIPAVVFVLAMIFGMVIAQQFFGADQER